MTNEELKNWIDTVSYQELLSVKESDYFADATFHIIDAIETNSTAKGDTHVYRDNSWCLYDFDCYLTKEEALTAAESKRAVAQEEDRTRIEYIKKDCKKSFAWNAGYHMREYKDKTKQAAYHFEKARICKERSKQE